MNNTLLGTPLSVAICDQLKNSFSRYYLPDHQNECHLSTTTPKQSSIFSLINKLVIGRKVDSFSQEVREHVRLGSAISETVMGKLSLGAEIVQVGGVKKVFKHFFNVGNGEKLLKASQCYLSTTSGPLAGLLFISTDKVSFCTERSIKVFSTKGHMCRLRYKVSIPLKRIKYMKPSRNVEKPTEKYLEIFTEDNFEFWFLGFLKYQKTINYLEKAISQAKATHCGS
ncbi:GEM-like protein 7 [Vigna radiata var. radiata]|uniref:GEM-like protein 7 n=1 Tax=Vigna radiata var. radiata TaxID=3916 RepID=A0A1S3VQL8_VIGRR|nr:GEM-like protein 7 [Vigna radiata var. radiata]